MTNDAFEVFKKLLETKEYTKPSNLSDLSVKYWYEIRKRYYNFDRTEEELKKLRSIQKSDFVIFAKVSTNIFNYETKMNKTYCIFFFLENS